MLRRHFITGLGGAVLWPLGARAQQRRKVPRVGVLWHAGSAEEEAVYLDAVKQGLASLGYVDGQTIVLEHRFPNEEPERFVSLAAELVTLRVDVLVAVTRLAALAAQRATTTIPTIFIVVPDPVGTKLVKSLARPGGNITGLTHIAAELSAKRLAFFKEAFPQMKRIALLVNGNDRQGMLRYIDENRSAAALLGLDVQPIEVRSVGEFEPACSRIAEAHFDGIVVGPDGLFYQGREAIAQAALKRQIPLMVYSRETVQAGALMSYGADVRDIFRRSATYIDKILKGEAAAELPVEQPTKFEFLVNLKTAKSLALQLEPILLAQADEVIE